MVRALFKLCISTPKIQKTIKMSTNTYVNDIKTEKSDKTSTLFPSENGNLPFSDQSSTIIRVEQSQISYKLSESTHKVILRTIALFKHSETPTYVVGDSLPNKTIKSNSALKELTLFFGTPCKLLNSTSALFCANSTFLAFVLRFHTG